MGWTAWLYKFEPDTKRAGYIDFLDKHDGKVFHSETGVVKFPKSFVDRAENIETYRYEVDLITKVKSSQIKELSDYDEAFSRNFAERYYEFAVEYTDSVPLSQDESWVIFRRGAVYNFFLKGDLGPYTMYVSSTSKPLKKLIEILQLKGTVPSPSPIELKDAERLRDVLNARVKFMRVDYISEGEVASVDLRAKKGRDVVDDPLTKNAITRGLPTRIDITIEHPTLPNRVYTLGTNGRISTRANIKLPTFISHVSEIFKILVENDFVL